MSSGSVLVSLPNLSVPSGAYKLCAYVTAFADCSECNDTACTNLVGIPTLPITYCDDFESGNIGWSTGLLTAAVSQGTQWALGTPANGVTTGAHSGTNAWDINLTSGYGNNAGAILYTPYFDMDSAYNCVLSFWQNYRTDNGADGVRLEYSIDSALSWNILGTAGTIFGVNWYNSAALTSTPGLPGWSSSSNGWQKAAYYLLNEAALNNQPNIVQFRFIFTSDFGQNVTDGYSIDDFCITQPPPNDLGVSVISPTGGVPAGNPLTARATIHNYGTNVQTSDTIMWSYNGPQTNYLWTGTLNPGADDTITLGTFVPVVGTFSLCGWSSWTADQDHSNDSICSYLIGIPTYNLDYNNWWKWKRWRRRR